MTFLCPRACGKGSQWGKWFLQDDLRATLACEEPREWPLASGTNCNHGSPTSRLHRCTALRISAILLTLHVPVAMLLKVIPSFPRQTPSGRVTSTITSFGRGKRKPEHTPDQSNTLAETDCRRTPIVRPEAPMMDWAALTLLLLASTSRVSLDDDIISQAGPSCLGPGSLTPAAAPCRDTS